MLDNWGSYLRHFSRVLLFLIGLLIVASGVAADTEVDGLQKLKNAQKAVTMECAAADARGHYDLTTCLNALSWIRLQYDTPAAMSDEGHIVTRSNEFLTLYILAWTHQKSGNRDLQCDYAHSATFLGEEVVSALRARPEDDPERAEKLTEALDKIEPFLVQLRTARAWCWTNNISLERR